MGWPWVMLMLLFSSLGAMEVVRWRARQSRTKPKDAKGYDIQSDPAVREKSDIKLQLISCTGCGKSNFVILCQIEGIAIYGGEVHKVGRGWRASCQNCGDILSVVPEGYFRHSRRALPISPIPDEQVIDMLEKQGTPDGPFIPPPRPRERPRA